LPGVTIMKNEHNASQADRQGSASSRLLQTNIGERNRVAGHNYYESITYSDSVLDIGDEVIIDELALNSERFFRRRFGFSVPKSNRQQVLDLQKQMGASDHQIRWLRRGGYLQLQNEAIRLHANKLMPAFALAGIGLLSIVYLFLFLHAVPSEHISPFQAVGTQLLIATVWFSIIAWMYEGSVKPWPIVKRWAVRRSNCEG
jgi:hypothetical protein